MVDLSNDSYVMCDDYCAELGNDHDRGGSHSARAEICFEILVSLVLPNKDSSTLDMYENA